MFVIFGANGKIGGTTARALRRRDQAVRVVVRDETKRGEWAAAGFEVAIADVRDARAIERAAAGATAVQVICPVSTQAEDAAADMKGVIDTIATGLAAAQPPAILAISDYGAQLAEGTGVTLIFHELEVALGKLPGRLIFVRSAEHMQNWARVLRVAVEHGILPSLHQPLSKQFPTVSANDVGLVAADLLLSPDARGVVHVEGPRRYTPDEVAATVAELLGRSVAAREIPRAEWHKTLVRGGVSASYADLIVELYDTHNAGGIDAEPGGEIRRGTTELKEALAPLAKR